jgi:hypothetical protein
MLETKADRPYTYYERLLTGRAFISCVRCWISRFIALLEYLAILCLDRRL